MIYAMTLLAAALTAPLQQFDTDTTIAVRPGTRLRIQNQGGDIVVRAWAQDRMRIRAEHSSRGYIEINTRGQTIELQSHRRGGMARLGGIADYEITVPVWMAVDLGGIQANVTVEGTTAPIKVQTIEGEIKVRGGAENVHLSTINGRIDVSGTRGRVELHSASEDIFATDIQGDLVIEAVSGDISMRGIDAKSVDVQTVSGEVTFEGRVANAGTYSFFSHSGDVTLAFPEAVSATVSLATATGDISSSFDLRAERETRRRSTFRLGSGSASVEVETFSGDLRLVRPSELKGQDDRKSKRPRSRRPGQKGDNLDSSGDESR